MKLMRADELLEVLLYTDMLHFKLQADWVGVGYQQHLFPVCRQRLE